MDTKHLNEMTGKVADAVFQATTWRRHWPFSNSDVSLVDSLDASVTHQEGPNQARTFVDGADVTSDAFTFCLYHDIDRKVEGRRGPGSRVPVGKVVYTVTVRASYTAFDGE